MGGIAIAGQVIAALAGLLLGLALAAPLSVLAERLPSAMPLWRRRHCGACGAGLPLSAHVPLLRFRPVAACPACGAGQPLRGIWIEAASALGTAAFLALQPGSTSLCAGLLLLWLGIAASATDLAHRLIPNRLLLGAGLLGVLSLAPGGWAAYVAGAEGLAALFAIGLLLALVGRGGLGLGDVKYLAVVGWLLGLPGGAASLIVAVVGGGLYAALLLVSGRAGRRDTIAFGPFIALGSVLVAALGPLGALRPL